MRIYIASMMTFSFSFLTLDDSMEKKIPRIPARQAERYSFVNDSLYQEHIKNKSKNLLLNGDQERSRSGC